MIKIHTIDKTLTVTEAELHLLTINKVNHSYTDMIMDIERGIGILKFMSEREYSRARKILWWKR